MKVFELYILYIDMHVQNQLFVPYIIFFTIFNVQFYANEHVYT